MEVFRLSGAMVRELIGHADAEYPKEACGMIVGPPGRPVRLYRLANVDPDPVMRYNVDSRELKKVFDEIYDNDWELLSIYHSHTHTAAFPSPTDVERAFYPEAVYALVSLADRERPDLRAFRILEGNIEELEVVTDGQVMTG